MHFTPHSSDHRPCWHCTSFVAMIYEGSAARCSLANAARVRSMPERGCSAWQREVGADDVPEAVPAWRPAQHIGLRGNIDLPAVPLVRGAGG